MKHLVIVSFDPTWIKYKRRTDLLVQGICKRIFPLSIYSRETLIKGVYHTQGYVQLMQFRGIGAAEILSILQNILWCIQECKEYLLFPNEYVINTETIYIKNDFSDMKFCYIPWSCKEKETMLLRRLIHQLKQLTTVEGMDYLNLLEERILRQNETIQYWSCFLEEWKEEIRFYQQKGIS